MIAKTFSVLFRLKKPTGYQKGMLPIYVRITVNGKRIELSAQPDCEPGKWNAALGRAGGTKEDIKNLNAYFDSLQRKAYEAHQALLDAREVVTAEKIKNKLPGVAERPHMILEIFQEHNDQMKTLIGNGYAPLTHKRYTTALEHTREFINWKFRLSDLEITKLNYEFIADFEFFLRSVRKCAHKSTMKYLVNFKKIVLFCVKKGWLQKDLFYGLSSAPKDVSCGILTQ